MPIDERVLTATSPGSATTAASTVELSGLNQYDAFTLDADIQGATGGTLDVILQRFSGGLWREWYRFPQLAAAAAALHYSYVPALTDSMTVVGVTVTPVLAVSTAVGGHPGNRLRFLFIAGASTSAGAIQTVALQCYRK
jgi:hypothetical protein